MLRLNALICSIAIFSSVSGLPPVNDRVYDDDYHAVIHRAMLKPFPGSVEADGYELKENELGFSWNNCGKLNLFIINFKWYDWISCRREDKIILPSKRTFFLIVGRMSKPPSPSLYPLQWHPFKGSINSCW